MNTEIKMTIVTGNEWLPDPTLPENWKFRTSQTNLSKNQDCIIDTETMSQ